MTDRVNMTRDGGNPSCSASGGLCVHDMLAACAERSPDATAILAPGRGDLIYGRLLAQVRDIAAALNSMGVGRDDRVALVLPNGPELAVAFLAVAACASCAPLNPSYRQAEFDFCLSDLRVRALVVPSGVESPATQAARARGIPIIGLSIASEAEAGVFTLEGNTAAPPARSGWAEPDDVALVLHTSGTTSRPKTVPLTQANICLSARNIHDSLELTAADRCLNVMPLFHVHGLMAALLSTLASGGSVVCTPGFDAERFFGWLEDFRPTWYTAVPTMHQAVLARAGHGQIGGNGSLRFIRSCSAALPPRVMAELEETFAVPAVEAYGMTEGAHQIACNPLPPRERKSGSVGVAVGQRVAIMDEAGRLLPEGETGEIVIRGQNVTRGYENNPAANASSFTDGWFRTGDEGLLDRDGYLCITGRLKEIINRGGEKVSPREVDEVLMDHPAVALAVTFAVPHAELGEDVLAAVVLREGASATGLELRDFAASRLSLPKLPRQVLIVDEMPKGPTGKLQRIGLSKSFAGLLEAEFVAARDDVEGTLADMWAGLLKVQRVGVNDDFFMLGGSSLLLTVMLSRVRTAFEVDLPLDSVFRQPTVAALAGGIREAKGDGPEAKAGGSGTPPQQDLAYKAAAWPVMVEIQPRGTRPPLFMVSFGLAWEAAELSRHLGQDQPVYGLRPSPLHGGRRNRVTAESLAAGYIREIRTVRPKGPYVLGGGCAAGIVAFEMAQQLTAQGESVPLLLLFDVDCPPPGFLPSWLNMHMLRLPRFVHHVLGLRPLQQRAHIREWARRWKDRIIDALQPGLAESEMPRSEQEYRGKLEAYMMRLVERHRRCVWSYRPRRYPGRIALFLARDTGVWFFRDWRLGWRRVAAGGCEVQVVPGEHNLALKEPHVRAVAERVGACIDAARANPPA